MKEKENYSILRDPVVKFFRGNNFAFLGTLNKDGSPQVTRADLLDRLKRRTRFRNGFT
jgi:hypothetical protein